jgi:hypothetical protein
LFKVIESQMALLNIKINQCSTRRTETTNLFSSVPMEAEFISNIRIHTLGEHDVLLGRGGGTNKHPGNIKFRRLVNEHKLRYMFCPKLEKPQVARDVVALWRALTPPGRFLSCSESQEMVQGPRSIKDCEWFEVVDRKAREKASQCLRERTRDVAPFLQQLRQHQDAITEKIVSVVHQQIALRNYNDQKKRAPESVFGNLLDPDTATQQQLINRQCDIDPGEQNMHCRSLPSYNEEHKLPRSPGTQRDMSMPAMMMTSLVSTNNGTPDLSPQAAANAYRRAVTAGVTLFPEEAAYLHAVETGTLDQAFPPSQEQTSYFLTSHTISDECPALLYNADSAHDSISTIMTHPDEAGAFPASSSASQSLEDEHSRMITTAKQQEMKRLRRKNQLGQREKFSEPSHASAKKQAMANPRLKNFPKNTKANENQRTDGSQENIGNGLASSQQTKTVSSVSIPPRSAESFARPPQRNAATPVKKKNQGTLSGDLGKMAAVFTSSKFASSKPTTLADTRSSFDPVNLDALISAAALTTNGADAIYQQQLRKYVTEMIQADPSLDEDNGTFDGSEALSDLDDEDCDDWEKEYNELNRRQGVGRKDGGERQNRGVDRNLSGISCLTETSGDSLLLNLDLCVFSGQTLSTTSSLPNSEPNTPSSHKRIAKGHDGSNADVTGECRSHCMSIRSIGSNRSSTSDMTDLISDALSLSLA